MRVVELDPIAGSSVPRGRHLGGGEVRALFEHLAQDPRHIARRDAAALALLFGAGVRRSEVAGLQRQDLDTTSGRILVRGNHRKERVAWLPPTALPAIGDWLQVRGDHQDPLLNPVLKGGRRQEGGVSPQAVYDLCLRLVRAAAIGGAHSESAHCQRRAVAFSWDGQAGRGGQSDGAAIEVRT